MALTDALTLGVVISADDRASGPVKRVGASVADLGRQLVAANIIASQFTRISRALINTGKGLIGFLGGAVGEAAQLQDQLLNVGKTTGLSDAAIEKLRESTLDLTRILPLTAKEMARVGEIGGALGLRTLPELEALMSATAKATIATNLSAEAAALGLGRLSAAFGTNIKEAEKVGSALTLAADNAATFEDEILRVTLRAAPVAKLLGLTQQATFGFAAAMKDAGILTEVAGSSLTRLFALLLKDPAKFATAANLSVGAFSQQLREAADAGEGAEIPILKFIKGLRETTKNSAELQAKLVGLVGQNARLTPAIAALVGNFDRLQKLVKITNEGFAAGTRFNEEFERKTRALNVQLLLLRNAFNEIRERLGKALIPVLDPIVRFLRAMAVGIAEFLKDKNRARIIAFSVVLAGMTLIIFGVVFAITAMIAAVIALGPVLLPFLALSVKVFGITALSIAAVTAAIVFLAKSWESNFGNIRDVVDLLVFGLKGIFNVTKDLLIPIIKSIQRDFRSMFGEAAAGGTVTEFIFKAIAGVILVLASSVAGVILLFASLVKGITLLGKMGKEVFQFMVAFFTSIRIVSQNFIADFIAGFARARDAGLGAFAAIKAGIINALGFSIRFITKQVNRLIAVINSGLIGTMNTLLPENLQAPLIPKIPAILGQGGIVTRPTTALVGERGPEAVIPLDQLESVLARVAGGGSTGTVQIPITVQIDGRTIFSTMRELALEELIRSGELIPATARGLS